MDPFFLGARGPDGVFRGPMSQMFTALPAAGFLDGLADTLVALQAPGVPQSGVYGVSIVVGVYDSTTGDPMLGLRSITVAFDIGDSFPAANIRDEIARAWGDEFREQFEFEMYRLYGPRTPRDDQGHRMPRFTLADFFFVVERFQITVRPGRASPTDLAGLPRSLAGLFPAWRV
jgi:hypothetical protein